MKPMYGFRQMVNTRDIKEYLDSWQVPCIIEDTPEVIHVKVPSSAMPLSTLVKCHAIPQLGMRLTFEKMTLTERIRSFFT